MKRIPTFDIFNKQQGGGNWDTVAQCLEYTALYMHTWSLFEWIIANIIAEDERVSGGESVRKIWQKDTNPKCDMLKRLYEAHPPEPKRDAVLGFVTRIICKTDTCRDLRDTIAHSHIYWVTSMGAYQQQTGWLRLKRNSKRLDLEKYDEEATEEWKNAASIASNPDLTEEDINTFIYTAYGKSEIVAELRKLMDYMRLLDYDPWTDSVLNYYRKTLA